jgi:hypothetical protein
MGMLGIASFTRSLSSFSATSNKKNIFQYLQLIDSSIFKYFIQHCFICHTLDFIKSKLSQKIGGGTTEAKSKEKHGVWDPVPCPNL